MNFPQTVEDMVNWNVREERDKLGVIHIITGYEGTGACFWCGKDLTGRQVRYCRGHWEAYWEYFNWAYARSWCTRRYYHRCANCGKSDRDLYIPGQFYSPTIEVHHIIPMDGDDRSWSVYNVPWNLICLCHKCHLLVHAIMRESTNSTVLDVFDLAIVRGQGVFSTML